MPLVWVHICFTRLSNYDIGENSIGACLSTYLFYKALKRFEDLSEELGGLSTYLFYKALKHIASYGKKAESLSTYLFYKALKQIKLLERSERSLSTYLFYKALKQLSFKNKVLFCLSTYLFYKALKHAADDVDKVRVWVHICFTRLSNLKLQTSKFIDSHRAYKTIMIIL